PTQAVVRVRPPRCRHARTHHRKADDQDGRANDGADRHGPTSASHGVVHQGRLDPAPGPFPGPDRRRRKTITARASARPAAKEPMPTIAARDCGGIPEVAPMTTCRARESETLSSVRIVSRTR